MCESTMIADGYFSPITIKENKLKFVYVDKYAVSHVLIDEFAMDMVINKAEVSELKNQNGDVIGYQFTLTKV